MFVGTLTLDLRLGDVHSLKQKRGVVRPIVAPDRAHCVDVLDSCERAVAGRPEVELLSARQRFVSEEDD